MCIGVSNECGERQALPSSLKHGELGSSQAKLWGSPGGMAVTVSLEVRTKMAGKLLCDKQGHFQPFLLIHLAHKKLEKAVPLCLADDFTQNPQRLQKLGKFGVIFRIFGPNFHLR